LQFFIDLIFPAAL